MSESENNLNQWQVSELEALGEDNVVRQQPVTSTSAKPSQTEESSCK
ncbi:hypothetical protein GDO81_005261 [Engystomops pustulosus]|uniref:Uncharacterized protein n=1 Tax=Engystomops pustulosus TaxID=76066 RepID=A0AAV7CM21_ENGPU|nr:hypothetical protein GDO81_005261 [Engystomops pustulosus]KAG8586130.1 hypothetical protein GDO81_005261 [Engystomops pustulosus]